MGSDYLESLITQSHINILSTDTGGRNAVSVNKVGIDINIAVNRKAIINGKLNIFLTDKPVSQVSKIRGCDIVITSSRDTLEDPVNKDNMAIE